MKDSCVRLKRVATICLMKWPSRPLTDVGDGPPEDHEKGHDADKHLRMR
jgi:hypothetical protein